jgi:hypothetical protein
MRYCGWPMIAGLHFRIARPVKPPEFVEGNCLGEWRDLVFLGHSHLTPALDADPM